MDLRKELRELSRLYESVGPINKLLLVISFFLSISSIASLSETVFKWKGFILDGIQFYQVFLVSPIIDYAAPLGLSYTRVEVHSIVMLSIATTLAMKLFTLDQVNFSQILKKKYGTAVSPRLSFFRFISIAYPLGLWVGYGISDDEVKLVPSLIVLLTYPIMLSGMHLCMTKLIKDSKELLGTFNYSKVYYTYLLLVSLVIGVLGAINAGLTKIA
ncbi:MULTISPECIES: hypothetical protein [Vibrio]|uniref:hypothetical protein n=1 Tax=Vibrio TaxID=662 RepID=UPI000A392C0D|nr:MULTISPECIES: hypothetical protein [Vibrio]MDE1212034.1 hypothetical protein [Vibrio aestuarianus]OUD76340.1 putative membrane protein [Vibrio vulnificus]